MTFRVPYERMLGEFERALADSGFDQADAAALARVFADNTCDGVASHGINRFPGFVRDVRGGRLDPAARAERVAALGALEQWDGHRGPGILNALACMDRAVELAREHAVGAVALRNTSHWMRAGTYGLRAAAAGCIGLCWTNTTRLMGDYPLDKVSCAPYLVGMDGSSSSPATPWASASSLSTARMTRFPTIFSIRSWSLSSRSSGDNRRFFLGA